MNILITNIWLNTPGGTEVYVRDLAFSLYNHGIHVEVFAMILGSVADEIKERGINVTNNLDELKHAPDLIHAQHFIPTMEVISRFPGVPLIYFLHDRTHLIDSPPKYSRILKYVAVDYNCLDRLLIDNGIEKEKTSVIYNWVDSNRFKLKPKISEKPLKALVFSNYANNDNHYKVIKEACDKMGIELSGIGQGFGNNINQPELLLKDYDIVFAKAKAAMEAMATGAAVILCDFRGLGEMVSMEKFDHYRKYNFGMKTLTRPIQTKLIIEEIEKYDINEIRKLSHKIVKEASFEEFEKQIIELYKTILENDSKDDRWKETNYDRIIKEYCSLKEMLVSNKINNLNEELSKNKEIIKVLKDDLSTKESEISTIKNTSIYKLLNRFFIPKQTKP